MPGEDKSTTMTNPDINTVNNAMNQNSQQERPGKQQQAQQQKQPQTVTADELMFYIQQAMEQVKFENKNEIVQALNAKAQQLSDTDPTTSTSLRAAAGAINEAVSDVVPLGENEEFNQQQAAQQQAAQQQVSSQQGAQEQNVKQASEVVWNTLIAKLQNFGYFEKNASVDEETINKDLIEITRVLGIGMDKYAADNDIDFTDSNYHDLLAELVLDNTLYQIGTQEIEKKKELLQKAAAWNFGGAKRVLSNAKDITGYYGSILGSGAKTIPVYLKGLRATKPGSVQRAAFNTMGKTTLNLAKQSTKAYGTAMKESGKLLWNSGGAGKTMVVGGGAGAVGVGYGISKLRKKNELEKKAALNFAAAKGVLKNVPELFKTTSSMMKNRGVKGFLPKTKNYLGAAKSIPGSGLGTQLWNSGGAGKGMILGGAGAAGVGAGMH